MLPGESAVVDNTSESLAIVAWLGIIVESLHLGHAPILVLLRLTVHHTPTELVLSQHPAEGGGRPRPVSYTRDLEISRVRYLELYIYLESVIYEICNRTDDDSRRMT